LFFGQNPLVETQESQFVVFSNETHPSKSKQNVQYGTDVHELQSVKLKCVC